MSYPVAAVRNRNFGTASFVLSWLLRDNYTTKTGTFNPTVTTNDGSIVTWVIGGVSYVTNSPSVAVSGTTTIKLYCPNPGAVTAINMYSQSLGGSLHLADLTTYTSLTTLSAYSNSALAGTGALADLPASMTYLHLGSTSSTITGAFADLPASMTNLYLDSTSSTITGALGDLPASMTNLYLYSTSSTITGALADLPASMTNLYLGSTSSTITGALADLPASMTNLYLYNTSSTITGALADLPSSMTYLHLGNTSSTITGGGTAMAAVNIYNLQIYSMTMSQSNVDSCVSRLYSDRASFLYASPVLSVGGTNPAPSGTYADATPPTTGKEYIYKLVNDPDAEGFKKWAITYTA